MKKKLLILYILFACFAVHEANAQYSIRFSGATPPASVCTGQPVGGIALYNGGTPVSNGWIYQVCPMPLGGFVPVVGGSGSFSSGLGFEVQLKTPTTSWGYSAASGTDMYGHVSWGNVILYAYDQVAAPGPGSTPVCSLSVLIVPSGEGIPGSVIIPGTTGIGSSVTFSVNTSIPFVTTGGTWSLSNGWQTCYYTGTPVGSNYLVVPQDIAPLAAGGYVAVTLPGTHSCSDNSAMEASLKRNVIISPSSGLTGSYLCGGSGTLHSNIGDNPATFSDLQTMIHRSDCILKKEWHYGSPSGPLLGTGQDLTVSTSGTYYLIVNQYNNVYSPAPSYPLSYGYDLTTSVATQTASYNVIVPGAGTLTSSFEINGAPLGATIGSAPPYFSCSGHTIVFTNLSSGPIETYLLTKTVGSTTTTITSGTGAPPSTLDISSYCTTSGFYYLTLTISNGCPASSTSASGWIYVNAAAPPSGCLQTTVSHDISGIFTTEYSLCLGTAWSSPQPLGRTSTIFTALPNFSSGNTCKYDVKLYSVDPMSGVLTFIWDGGLTTLPTCGTSIPTISIASLNPPYFFTNTTLVPNGSEWKIVVTLINDCGSTDVFRYFTIDDIVAGNGYLRHASNNASALGTDGEDIIKFTPVPFKAQLTAQISLQYISNTSLTITTADGRIISNAWQNENMDKGNIIKTINTSEWAPGMYFYKLMINGKPYAGKIIKD